MATITLKTGQAVLGKLIGKTDDGSSGAISGIVYRDFDTGILRKEADPNNPDEKAFRIVALAAGNTRVNFYANNNNIMTFTDFVVTPPPPATILEVVYEPVQ